MTHLHGVQKFANFAPDAVFFAADASDRQKTLCGGILGGKGFIDIYERPDQANTSLLRLRHGRKRCDTAIKQDVPQQRFGAVIGRMSKSKNAALELGSNLIKVVPPMPAAHVTPMRDIFSDQAESCRVLPHNPLDA